MEPVRIPAALPATIEVAAGLVFRGDKLLITQRHAGSHLGGLWEFPGGKRESGETFEACLHRELKEELAIEVRIEREVERIEHHYPEKRVRLVFYQCTWMAGEPQALGCPAFAWIGSSELDHYPFPAADARLLGRLRSEPALWGANP